MSTFSTPDYREVITYYSSFSSTKTGVEMSATNIEQFRNPSADMRTRSIHSTENLQTARFAIRFEGWRSFLRMRMRCSVFLPFEIKTSLMIRCDWKGCSDGGRTARSLSPWRNARQANSDMRTPARGSYSM